MRFFPSPAVLLPFFVYAAVQVAAQTCNGHAEVWSVSVLVPCENRYDAIVLLTALCKTI
jgi:hypothetical protein